MTWRNVFFVHIQTFIPLPDVKTDVFYLLLFSKTSLSTPMSRKVNEMK